MDMSLSKLQEMVKGRAAWCVAVHGAADSLTWRSDWTEQNSSAHCIYLQANHLAIHVLFIWNKFFGCSQVWKTPDTDCEVKTMPDILKTEITVPVYAHSEQ